MNYYFADLQNGENWEKVYTNQAEVLRDSAGGYQPLPEFEISGDFSEELIAIETKSDNIKYSWKFSGVLYRRFQLGEPSNSLPRASVGYHRLRINHCHLLHFVNYGINYNIVFDPYYWLKNISLNVWKYTGKTIENTDNLIEEIKDVRLPSIEEKLEHLSNYG